MIPARINNKARNRYYNRTIFCKNCGHALEWHEQDKQTLSTSKCTYTSRILVDAPVGKYIDWEVCNKVCPYQTYPKGYPLTRYW